MKWKKYSEVPSQLIKRSPFNIVAFIEGAAIRLDTQKILTATTNFSENIT